MSDPLSPPLARQTLGPAGRLLYDTKARTVWDRDTATLPWSLRRKRRAYRAFAYEQLAPLALRGDSDPASVDVRALFVAAARHGFQTEMLPPPLGDMPLAALTHSILLGSTLKAEEFCAACSGLGLALLAHDLGLSPLLLSGDRRAIFKWMRQIYKEIKAGQPAFCAFAITEPDAGSDVEDTEGGRSARLSCRAQRVAGGWQISGRKQFITGGAVAKWISLFAAQQDQRLESWTCFLLDRDMPGLTVGRKERKMGQRAADASELILEQVFVPADRLLGQVGGGWALNRNVLNYSRPGVAAIALGIARGAFESAAEFCSAARLAGRPLSAYQDVQLKLADMFIKISAMRATVWRAARYRVPFQAASSAAKVFCSDTAWEVCNQALELLGNHGCLQSNRVEKALRDVRLTQIYEGTNQINRLAVFESQLGAEFAPV